MVTRPTICTAQLAFFLGQMLLDAEGVMKKYTPFTKLSNSTQKWAWPCHVPKGSQKHFENLLDAEGILEKDLLLTKLLTFHKNGRGPATPFWVTQHVR